MMSEITGFAARTKIYSSVQDTHSFTKRTESLPTTRKATQKKCRKGSAVRIKVIVGLWKKMMIKTKRTRGADCSIDLTFHANELL